MTFLASDVGEKFSTGGITFAIGVCVTFIVLTVLIAIVTIVTKLEHTDWAPIFAKIFPKKSKNKAADVDKSTDEVVLSDTDNKKLVAAITAAINIVMSAEGDENAPKASFKVKSIKRI